MDALLDGILVFAVLLGTRTENWSVRDLLLLLICPMAPWTGEMLSLLYA